MAGAAARGPLPHNAAFLGHRDTDIPNRRTIDSIIYHWLRGKLEKASSMWTDGESIYSMLNPLAARPGEGVPKHWWLIRTRRTGRRTSCCYHGHWCLRRNSSAELEQPGP
eukprot:COSAG06_NODE_26909_length_605_cov_0.573123_1_plen_109_part_10